jgi:Periplasmic protein TonB, links inner and outer membranes
MNYKAWAAALSVVLLCSAGVASEADARVPAAVIAQAQMSMMLDGTIDVEADGRVSALRIDGEADYPGGVVAHVHQVVQGWEFEPVLRDGQPVAFTTPMTIRLVASQIGDGGYEIRIASTRFGEHDPEDRSRVRTLAMTPPRYPEQAYRAGVTGTVYLAVQVGRDGQVLDVAAEQVDLTSAGTERVMAQARELLARTSTQAARRWRFRPRSRVRQHRRRAGTCACR